MDEEPSTGSLEALRHRNRQRVVGALARTGLASRADLARSTGLSRTTVSSLVGELLATGLVVEREDLPGPSPTARGRPPARAARPGPLGRRRRRPRPRPRPHPRRRRRPLAHRDRRGEARDRRRRARPRRARPHLRPRRGARSSARASATTRSSASGIGPRRPGRLRHQDARLVDDPARLAGRADRGDAGGAARHQRARRERRQPRRARRVVVRRRPRRGRSSPTSARTPASAPASSSTAGSTAAPAAPPARSGHVIVDEHGPVCRCGNRGCLETVAAEGAILDLLRRTHGPDITMPQVLAARRGRRRRLPARHRRRRPRHRASPRRTSSTSSTRAWSSSAAISPAPATCSSGRCATPSIATRSQPPATDVRDRPRSARRARRGARRTCIDLRGGGGCASHPRGGPRCGMIDGPISPQTNNGADVRLRRSSMHRKTLRVGALIGRRRAESRRRSLRQ